MSTVGRLVIHYNQGASAPYTIGFNLLDGVDPSNEPAMQAEADTVAEMLAACVPNFFHFTDWHSTFPDGSTAATGSLTTPFTGSHGFVSGMTAFFCTTLRFLGRSGLVLTGERFGNTSAMLHVANGYAVTQGMKYVDGSADTALSALIGHLRDNTVMWADTNGNKASVRTLVAFQFNAHTQRRLGS